MAQINKRTIFLKDDKGSITATAAFTEIFNKITVKVKFNVDKKDKNHIFAVEGDKLPLQIFEIDGNADLKLDIKSELGNEITVIMFYKSLSVSKLICSGYFGKNNIKPEGILSRIEKRMIGAKIVATQQDIVKKEFENEAKHDKTAEAYQKTHEQIKGDKYIAEDTALSDIDLIAEENYYENEKNKKTEIKENMKENLKDFAHYVKKPFQQSNNKWVMEESEYTDENLQIKSENKDKSENLENLENNNSNINNYENYDNLENSNNIINYEDLDNTENNESNYGLGTWYDEKDFENTDYVNWEDSFNALEDDYQKQDYQNGDENINMEYYEKVKSKLSKLLAQNEKEENLCTIIPESEFVKIFYDNDKYYCVGLVKENGTPVYICYGVPLNYSDNPPEEFAGLSKWIPIETNNPRGKGYYMMFQTVSDGNYIKI